VVYTTGEAYPSNFWASNYNVGWNVGLSLVPGAVSMTDGPSVAPLVAFSTGHTVLSRQTQQTAIEGATHVNEVLPSDMNKIAIWNLRSGLYDHGRDG
jgi:hypothetical protein